MSNLKLKTSDLPEDWKGYTIEELQYRRAYVATCSELAKDRLIQRVQALRSNTLKSAAGAATSITRSMPLIGMAFTVAKVGSRAYKFIKNLRVRRKNKKKRLKD